MKKITVLAFVLVIIQFMYCNFDSGLVYASGIPTRIDYNGYIKSGGSQFSGTGQFKFAIINSDGSATYWSNDGTSTAGSEPFTAVSTTVTNGVFNTILGDTSITNMTAISANIFPTYDTTYLRVWFNDGTSGFEWLSPDKQIVATPYAYQAYRADGLNGNLDVASMPTGGDWSLNSDLNIENDTLVVDTDDNRVGIGTASPSTHLEVYSSTEAPIIRLNQANGLTPGTLQFYKDASAFWHIYGPSASNNLYFSYSNSVILGLTTTGQVGIGTLLPETSAALEIDSEDSALLVSRMTTTQRDALGAVNGMIIYNSTTNQFNFRENNSWVTK